MAAAGALAAAGYGPAMAARPAYGQVAGVADLDRVFEAIRADVGRAQSRAELTRLYRRAGYLVTLTYSRSWRARFAEGLPRLREDARRQFRATAEAINRRAGPLGTDGDYAESWGDR